MLENATQATARDVFTTPMSELEKHAFTLIFHVHDELISECDDRPEDDTARLSKLMCANPEWADGLPLMSKGEDMRRYGK